MLDRVNPDVDHQLPRNITDNVLWTGSCVELTYAGVQWHGHFSTYIIRGSKHTAMVDTGHPLHRQRIDRDIDAFLGDRPVDYLFATHQEFPHAGLLGHWLDRYPDMKVVGNVRDYDLYFPKAKDRFVGYEAGESIDLGDRRLLMLPAVWRDLPDSLWAFDTTDRVLFVADGFSYLHAHMAGECSQMMSERKIPDPAMLQFFNERALQWTKYRDAAVTFEEMDRLMTELKPRFLAGAHGGIIDNVETALPIFKHAMSLPSQS